MRRSAESASRSARQAGRRVARAKAAEEGAAAKAAAEAEAAAQAEAEAAHRRCAQAAEEEAAKRERARGAAQPPPRKLRRRREAAAKVDQDGRGPSRSAKRGRQLEETKAAAAAAESEAEARIKADAAAQAARRTPRPSGEMVAADEVTPAASRREAAAVPGGESAPRRLETPADGSPDPTVPTPWCPSAVSSFDGKDGAGRPVAVINASKLPEESDMRSTALQHILACPRRTRTPGEKLGFSLVVYYTARADAGSSAGSRRCTTR